jgi:outer membrane immunogenic protein
MKKVSGLLVAVVFIAAPASGADLAVKAPVYKALPPVPVFSWTGCYLGADVGGAWARQSTSAAPTAAEYQASVAGPLGNSSSAIGGPYAGCNYQFAPRLVLGLEGDFSWLKLDEAASFPNLYPGGTSAGSGGIFLSRSTDWVASLRGRLGYAVVPNVLAYGTGGAAWTRSRYAALDLFNDGTSVASSLADTRTGWVAGGGIDWAPWSNNWILSVEYLHYQFGGTSFTGIDAATVNGSVKFGFGDLTIDTVRAGVSYKF